MTTDAPSITWWQDDPQRLHAECEALRAAAPGLTWNADGPGRWHGEVPLWPFGRPQPTGLPSLVGNRPLSVEVICSAAYPMMAPFVFPVSVEPPIGALGYTEWHLLPHGALCLFRGTAWWDPARLIASLVPKISGWYIEFHLMMANRLRWMPDCGVDCDGGLDGIIDQDPDSDP
jgi:hypothetical protein